MKHLLLLVLALCVPAHACVNTTYSVEEERQITGDLTKVIMGEVPRHSESFWYHELRRTDGNLAADPEDVESLNDRAVALLKLRRFDEAEQAFLEIEDRFPGRYRTASNLGVLYKKTGVYDRAAEMTRRALAIKPSGHLGLGDYYRRMLEWRARVALAPIEKHRTNFLGIERSTPEAVAANPLVNREYLVTLIKADHDFADAYAVLGDVLYAEADYANAFRAWERAWRLDPIPAYEERRNLGTPSEGGARGTRRVRDFDRELAEAETWLAEYQSTEIALLEEREAGRLPPLAGEVLEVMRRQGVATPRYVEIIESEDAISYARPVAILLAMLLGFFGFIALVARVLYNAFVGRNPAGAG